MNPWAGRGRPGLVRARLGPARHGVAVKKHHRTWHGMDGRGRARTGWSGQGMESEMANGMESEMANGEVKEPTRAKLVTWTVELIQKSAPAHGSTVPRAEIIGLTGLEWGSDELRFVLIDAKKILYRGSPAYEFRVTVEGLYVFTDEERVDELGRRTCEARARYRESLASSATIDQTKLCDNAKKELEHRTRLSLHLYEEAKRAERRRWLTSKPKPSDSVAIEDGRASLAGPDRGAT